MLKYYDYNNVFLAKNIAKLLENTKINKHIIKLEKDKQPFFILTYSLESVELKTLKTYIKTNLASNFIQSFKSLARALILFDKKPNKSLHFYMNY